MNSAPCQCARAPPRDLFERDGQHLSCVEADEAQISGAPQPQGATTCESSPCLFLTGARAPHRELPHNSAAAARMRVTQGVAHFGVMAATIGGAQDAG